jgi:ribosomal protein S14
MLGAIIGDIVGSLGVQRRQIREIARNEDVPIFVKSSVIRLSQRLKSLK